MSVLSERMPFKMGSQAFAVLMPFGMGSFQSFCKLPWVRDELWVSLAYAFWHG